MATAFVVFVTVVGGVVALGIATCLLCHWGKSELKEAVGTQLGAFVESIRKRHDALVKAGEEEQTGVRTDPDVRGRKASRRRGGLLERIRRRGDPPMSMANGGPRETKRARTLVWAVGLVGVGIGYYCLLSNYSIFKSNFEIVYCYDAATASRLGMTLACAVGMIAMALKGAGAMGARGPRLWLVNASLIALLVGIACYQSLMTYDRIEVTRQIMTSRSAAAARTIGAGGGRLRIAGRSSTASAPSPTPHAAPTPEARPTVGAMVEAALPVPVCVAESIAWYFGLQFIVQTLLFVVAIPLLVERRALAALLTVLPEDAEQAKECVAKYVEAFGEIGTRVVKLLHPLQRLRFRLDAECLATQVERERHETTKVRSSHEAEQLEHRMEMLASEASKRLERDRQTDGYVFDLEREKAVLKRELAKQEARTEAAIRRLQSNTEGSLARHRRELSGHKWQDEQSRKISQLMIDSWSGMSQELRDVIEQALIGQVRHEVSNTRSLGELFLRCLRIYGDFRALLTSLLQDDQNPPRPVGELMAEPQTRTGGHLTE